MNFLKSLWRKLFPKRLSAQEELILASAINTVLPEMMAKGLRGYAYDPSEDEMKNLSGENESYFDS